MQLSARLAAVADMARDAGYLADIGTDHGYVPIYLALYGRLQGAVAMDINRGPLMRAKEHIRQYHLEDRIATRLSDGAEKLLPGEADTVVIAGMGGALTMEILARGEEQLRDVKTFVLQPQSEIEEVRRFLHRCGFAVTAENMVKDAGKYYPMMKAVHGRQEKWEECEYCYGKYLLLQKNNCLLEYLLKEERACGEIMKRLRGQEGAHIEMRRTQLMHRLEVIRTAISRF